MGLAHIIIGIAAGLFVVLLGVCVGIALYMNRANKPKTKQRNDKVVEKKPIADIENLDIGLFSI
ncbi:MAG: hypothetical protein J1F17_00400 [Oscillospiraceae bacterium]|nr:hypothetical protein [Oscillospiraceae bacterium]